MGASTATRSPAFTAQRAAARSPIHSMIPNGSCPGITGRRTGMVPVYCSTSLPQMPHASTRSKAPSSSSGGIGSSRNSSRRGAVWTMARVVRGSIWSAPRGRLTPRRGGSYRLPRLPWGRPVRETAAAHQLRPNRVRLEIEVRAYVFEREWPVLFLGEEPGAQFVEHLYLAPAARSPHLLELQQCIHQEGCQQTLLGAL